MKALLCACCLLLLGCDSHQPQTNDQIIAETKKCEAAGMEPKLIYNAWTNEPLFIRCDPKKKP